MSDAGIEAAGDETAGSKSDEALVEARLAALIARFPDRFSEEEISAIRTKIAGHVALAKTLHGAPLDPTIEPPPFVPYDMDKP